jgi:long-chain acyl-CoA synthetase
VFEVADSESVYDTFESKWESKYPKGVKRELHIPEISLYEVLENAVKTVPKGQAIDFIGKKFTFKELNTEVNKLAKGLSSLGVKKSDRIAVMLPNSPHYVIAFFAAMKLGCTVVNLNPLYTDFEIREKIVDSTTTTFITLDDFFPKIQKFVPSLLNKVIISKISDYLPNFVGSIYSLSKKLKRETVKVEETKNIFFMKNVMNNDGQINKAVIDIARDPAVIQYTGGTTGTPKGALLTHRNLVSNTYALTEFGKDLYKNDLVVLSAIPFFHIYGLTTALLTPIYWKKKMIILPDPRDTPRVMKTISTEKNLIYPGIPTMYHSILMNKNSSKINLSNINGLLSGGAPLPQEIEIELSQKTGGMIIEGYGLTEASPIVCATPVNRNFKKVNSVGVPFPGTRIKIVDRETGIKEMPLNEPGELIISGPQVMLGYLNNKKETEDTIRNGWLFTGDIGFVDDEGYIHIIDRKKDLIIAGGYNVYPREVEEILLKNEKIEDAAVIGVKDIHRGENVKAFIVLKKNQKMTEDEVKKYCLKYLAVFKVPRIVQFTDSIPKTVVGKILRRELREDKGNN